MCTVTVTFKLDGDDCGDRTGVTEDTFVQLNDEVSQMGGYDLEISKGA